MTGFHKLIHILGWIGIIEIVFTAFFVGILLLNEAKDIVETWRENRNARKL